VSQFLFTLLNGVTLAAVFFLVASGLTLIFGLMRVINLAHGGYYLFAAYFSYTIMQHVHNWALGALISSLFMAIAGTIIYLVLLRRFQYEELRVALITLGISLVLQQLMLALFGGDAYQISVPQPLQGAFHIPGMTIGYPKFRIVFLGFAIITGVALWALMSKTKFGSIIRAGVDDTKMVAALGIDIQKVFTIVIALGCALVGFAGAVGGTSIAYGMGTDGDFLLFSLQVVIIGGLGSIGGVAIGSLLVGLIGQMATAYIPTMSGALPFIVMIVVLAFRPQGILGRKL
jgi:branched-chain amino acid transport system permease protein